MKITLDLETNVITVPKNFFRSYEKQNKTKKKMGGGADDTLFVCFPI